MLTDGRGWEFYVVESVSATADEVSDNIDLDNPPAPVIRLYGSGRIAIVDKQSASVVFGNLPCIKDETYAKGCWHTLPGVMSQIKTKQMPYSFVKSYLTPSRLSAMKWMVTVIFFRGSCHYLVCGLAGSFHLLLYSIHQIYIHLHDSQSAIPSWPGLAQRFRLVVRHHALIIEGLLFQLKPCHSNWSSPPTQLPEQFAIPKTLYPTSNLKSCVGQEQMHREYCPTLTLFWHFTWIDKQSWHSLHMPGMKDRVLGTPLRFFSTMWSWIWWSKPL